MRKLQYVNLKIIHTVKGDTFYFGYDIYKLLTCRSDGIACFLIVHSTFVFSSPDPKGHVSYCHHWASVVYRPSVNFSHFNQLLWSHWANLNQTLVEWSLDGPLPNLSPVIPTSNQDGRQAKNRKRGDEILIVHCCFSISQNELKF